MGSEINSKKAHGKNHLERGKGGYKKCRYWVLYCYRYSFLLEALSPLEHRGRRRGTRGRGANRRTLQDEGHSSRTEEEKSSQTKRGRVRAGWLERY